MMVNSVEMKKMVDDTYKPGFEIIAAVNSLGELAKELGFEEDPRFKEANSKLIKSMMEFQAMSFNRGMDLCRANAIVDKLNESKIGRYMVDKAKKETGWRG